LRLELILNRPHFVSLMIPPRIGIVYAKNVKDSVTAAIGTGCEHLAPFIAKTHSKRFNLLAALLPRPKAPAD
jgi:hypothetical protein